MPTSSPTEEVRAPQRALYKWPGAGGLCSYEGSSVRTAVSTANSLCFGRPPSKALLKASPDDTADSQRSPTPQAKGTASQAGEGGCTARDTPPHPVGLCLSRAGVNTQTHTQKQQ